MPAMCVCVTRRQAWWQVVTLPERVENLRINVQLLEIDKHAIDIDIVFCSIELHAEFSEQFFC